MQSLLCQWPSSKPLHSSIGCADRILLGAAEHLRFPVVLKRPVVHRRAQEQHWQKESKRQHLAASETEARLQEQLRASNAAAAAAQQEVEALQRQLATNEAVLARKAAKLQTYEQRATEAEQQIAALQDEVGLTQNVQANLATDLCDHPVASLIHSLHKEECQGRRLHDYCHQRGSNM